MGGSRKRITSPVFSLKANEEVAWCLRVYPNGVDDESNDYLSVFLVLLSCPESPVWAKFEFWITNCSGEKYQHIKSHNAISFLHNQQRGFKKFILQDILLSNPNWLLPEDQPTLCCKVSILRAFFSMPGQNMILAIGDSRHRLKEDLGELWENSLFTDCCLLVGGQEFRGHKAILADRSPVFRAMVEHEMKESLMNQVEIHDLDLQVFKEMMGFIYTGKAPNLHSHPMATGVLAAADKYGLEDLNVMCEDALCRNLSVENAVHTLMTRRTGPSYSWGQGGPQPERITGERGERTQGSSCLSRAVYLSTTRLFILCFTRGGAERGQVVGQYRIFLACALKHFVDYLLFSEDTVHCFESICSCQNGSCGWQAG